MTRAETGLKKDWVIRLSDIRDYLEYYTPTELKGLLEGYEYEDREFWKRAFERFQDAFTDKVFGYIVDFTYDGYIDKIAAVIVDCERREIKLVNLETWAQKHRLE